MSDLNWCTYCDKAINHYSESLYCSEECLKWDALAKNPLLGYEWDDFINFPRSSSSTSSSSSSSQQNNPKNYKIQTSEKNNSSLSSITKLSLIPLTKRHPNANSSRSTTIKTPHSSSSSSTSIALSSSSHVSSIYGSPALTTSCSTIPNSLNSNSYSNTLSSFKFDLMPFIQIETENNIKISLQQQYIKSK